MLANRRTFLQGSVLACCALAAEGGGVLAQTARAPAVSPNGKPLSGVFPIGWTPCRADNSLDTDAMSRQRQFLNRGKVAGIAWPQNASGWQSLTPAEWHAGAEALASANGHTALVLGVQTVGFDTAASQAYARKARSLNADAIISLTPPGASDAATAAYFKALSDACGLPIMVQAVGDVRVDNLVALARAVPAVMAVKDEAGDPLERAADLLRRAGDQLEDFSGGGGLTFFAELELGFRGTMPYAGMADVLQVCFNAYMAGRKTEAYDMFGRFLAFNSLPFANDYVMMARGVFPEDAIMRSNPAAGAGGRRRAGPITGVQKAQIRTALETYLKGYLVA